MSKPARLRADEIFHFAVRHVSPFVSRAGQPCASVPEGTDGHRILALDSPTFRQWLRSMLLHEFTTFPTHAALENAIDMLAGESRFGDFPAHNVAHRIAYTGKDASHPASILLDLGNGAGGAIEITPKGWSTREAFDFFDRPDNALPLPEPAAEPIAPDKFLRTLQDLLNVRTREDVARVCIWLTSALRATPPYPALVLTGPPASGKTTAARMLRALIDPVVAPFAPEPATPRQLFSMAWRNHVLAFDHVTHLRASIVSALARVATGAAFEMKDRFADLSALAVTLARPVLMTTPERTGLWGRDPSFTAASLTVELAEIPANARRGEAALWSEFERLRPALLSTLLNATSSALRRARHTSIENVSRHVDAAVWAAAAAPVLGLRNQDIAAALTPDPIVAALRAMVAENGEWKGTASQLCEALTAHGVAAAANHPRALSSHLRHARLAAYAITVDFGRSHGGRTIHVTQTPGFRVNRARSA